MFYVLLATPKNCGRGIEDNDEDGAIQRDENIPPYRFLDNFDGWEPIAQDWCTGRFEPFFEHG